MNNFNLLKIGSVFFVTILFLILGHSQIAAKESLPDYLNTLAPSDRRNGLLSPSANVTIVTFEDYQCEACAYNHKIVKELMRLYSGRLNFIFRHYPLTNQHPNALKAAAVVETAATQGKFWEMHSKLLENQSEWANSSDPTDDFKRYADLFGPLTIPDPYEANFAEIIKRDETDAKKLGVKGTPTTFVNGRNVGYVSDLETITKEIEKDILGGWFKFYNTRTGKEEDIPPREGQFEIIVASGDIQSDKTSTDVIKKLPITLKYESEGKTFEQTIPNEPTKTCRGATGCSIPGPSSADLPGDSAKWKITAYDPSGQEIAIYNGGIGSQDSLWYWKSMEEFRKQEEEDNPFNPKNPQFIFAAIFFLLLFLAWWVWHRKR